MAKSNTITFSCEVINIKGLHARAAAKIVSTSSTFKSKVTLSHKTNSAPSLSLIKLLTLDAPKGSIIQITVIGEDAALSSSKLKQLFQQGFDELNE